MTDEQNEKDKRAEPRVSLRFKVAIIYHQHPDQAAKPTFHGLTNDISASGMSVVVENNIFNPDEVTVLIALPPEHMGAPQRVIETTAKMVYTVYSSKHEAFRVGLAFKHFKHNGRQLINDVVSRRIR